MKLHFVVSPIELHSGYHMLALCEALIRDAELTLQDEFPVGGSCESFVAQMLAENSLNKCRECLKKLQALSGNERVYIYGVTQRRKAEVGEHGT